MIKYIGNGGWDNFSSSTIDECVEYLNTIEYIGLDTETEGFDPHTNKLLLLQVGNKQVQYVINCLEIDISSLKKVLEEKTILMHNAKFDLRFMYHYGIDITNIYDTFLGEVILHTGYNTSDSQKEFYIDTSLKGVVRKYCNEDLDKTVRGKIHKGLSKEVIEYAAKDIEFLEEVMHKQLVEVNKWDLNKVIELENEVVRVFALMEYNGISFNKSKIIEVVNELNIIHNNLINTLDDIIVKDSIDIPKLKKFTKVQLDMFNDVRSTIINWSSSAQKTNILNIYGLNVPGVSDKILQQNKTRNKLIPLFIEYSKFSKLKSSFGEALLDFINPATKRIHASVWQILVTGRISMSEPNLQQIPAHSELGRKIKSCFIPREGYKLVSADYSGMELRIIAEHSQDPLWVKTFNEDADLHSILCAETFGIPIEDVKKPFPPKPDISYRFLQKTINFGLIN